MDGEIRDLLRKEFASTRRPLSALQGGDQRAKNEDRVVGQVNSLIARVAGASVSEIEKLISQLQRLRDFLRNEGERVQREVTAYAQLSDDAMKSTKVIANTVSQWKRTVDNARA